MQVNAKKKKVPKQTTIGDDNRPDPDEKNKPYEHLVEYCFDLYEAAKKSTYREAKIKEITDCESAYAQEEIKTNDPWPGASNIQLPLTTISVDNLEPRMVSGLIGKRPFIKFEMEGEQQQPEGVKIIEAWFNNELEEVVKIGPSGRDMVHKMLLEGTIYPIPTYDSEDRKIRDFAFLEDAQQIPELMLGLQPTLQMDPATGAPVVDPESGGPVAGPSKIANLNGVLVEAATGDPIVIEKVEQIFEGGKIEFAPFKDIFIPDDADDWEKTPVVRRVYPTYAELMQSKAEKKLGYITENIGPWLVREQTSDKKGEDQQSPGQEIAGVELSKKVIKCLECSISYIYREKDQKEEEVTDFTEERIVALIAEDAKILLRLCLLRDLNWKNQHLIRRVRLFPERGKSYGTPLGQKIRTIQKGASKTFNTAINIAEIVMIPWYFYTKRAGIHYEGKLVPGMGVECDDTKELYFPSFSVNPGQMFEYLGVWQQFWEKVVSIGDLQAGRPSSEKTTATEVLSVIEEGNIKHNYQAETVKAEFIEVFVVLYDLYYQFMPLQKQFLYNNEMMQIPRAAMRQPFNFRLTGSTELSNKMIQRKETEDFFKFARPDPMFNPVTLAEDLCRSYNRTDIARYINPQIFAIVQAIIEVPGAAQLFEQALAEAQALAAQAQAQAEGQQGGGGGPPNQGGGPPQ